MSRAFATFCDRIDLHAAALETCLDCFTVARRSGQSATKAAPAASPPAYPVDCLRGGPIARTNSSGRKPAA